MGRQTPADQTTLAAITLAPTLAARVAGLPEADQAALARLVQDIGEDGLDRIIKALATGGRPSDHVRRLPLLRQMAAEMRAKKPQLGGTGGNWREGADAAAAKVANSPEAKTLGQSPDATKKWLTREWRKHGRRLLQDHRAAEALAQSKAMQAYFREAGAMQAHFREIHEAGEQWNKLVGPSLGLGHVLSEE